MIIIMEPKGDIKCDNMQTWKEECYSKEDKIFGMTLGVFILWLSALYWVIVMIIVMDIVVYN